MPINYDKLYKLGSFTIILLLVWKVFSLEKQLNLEGFAGTVSDTDIQSIKEYNDHAKKMVSGKMQVPGNLKVDGTLNVGKTVTFNKNKTKNLTSSDFPAKSLGYGFSHDMNGFVDYIHMSNWSDKSGGEATTLAMRKRGNPGMRLFNTPYNSNKKIKESNWHDVVTYKDGLLYANGNNITDELFRNAIFLTTEKHMGNMTANKAVKAWFVEWHNNNGPAYGFSVGEFNLHTIGMGDDTDWMWVRKGYRVQGYDNWYKDKKLDVTAKDKDMSISLAKHNARNKLDILIIEKA